MREGQRIQVQQSDPGSFFENLFLPICLCWDLPRNKDTEHRLGNELSLGPVLPLNNGLCRWVTSISWHNLQEWDWKFKSNAVQAGTVAIAKIKWVKPGMNGRLG